jgi:hypothetical protein
MNKMKVIIYHLDGQNPELLEMTDDEHAAYLQMQTDAPQLPQATDETPSAD